MGKAKYGGRNFREKLWLYTAEQTMEGPIPRVWFHKREVTRREMTVVHVTASRVAI